MSAAEDLAVVPARRFTILAYKARPVRQTIRMDRFIHIEPLELEYLSTYLEGDDVTLLDGTADRRDPVALAKHLGADIVLLTSFITNVSDVLEAAARLKRLPRPPYVFVGGPHAEVVPEDFYSNDVDGVFFANQLIGLSEVVNSLRHERSFLHTPGASFRQGTHWRRNPGPPLEPAKLAVPRRTAFLANPEKYHYLYFRRCAVVKTAFGCHARCTFCFCAEQHGGRFGPRPVEDVVSEIEAIPADNVFILDDNFLSSRARTTKFARLIIERKVEKQFIIYGGADFVSKNPDVMAELHAAGVRALISGFEFVSDGALVAVNKRARLEDNDRTVEICRALGIELFALFVVDPHWRRADFRALARYVKSRDIAFATFSTYTVLPGTALARQCGSKKPGPRWRYDLLRLHDKPKHISAAEYYLRLFALYLAPGLRRSTIRRLIRHYGPLGYLRLLMMSWVVGLEFMAKLILWR